MTAAPIRAGHFARFGRLLAWVVLTLPLLFSAPAGADETLTYDANGNVETRSLPGGTTTYGYDDLNRVSSEAGPAKTQTLTYDPNGNRTSDASGTHTYAGSSDRQLTIAGQSISLDAAGNTTQARGLNFTWNQAGQLKTVSQGGSLLATYYYDYQGRRSRKVKEGVGTLSYRTTLYVYDLYDRLISELNGAGNPQRTYVWRDNIPVAIILHGGESVLYLETDHLNTPIAARNQAGTVVWKWESDAFGSTPANEDPDGDGVSMTINLRFPGQYYDKESGLHYNHHRYYDPKLGGRYISPDPIGLAGGINPMMYGRANPLRYVDPLGLETTYSVADLAIIQSHLSFVASVQGDDFSSSQSFAPERAMLDRLARGMDSSFDIGFLRHERLEADICKQKFKGLNPKKLSPEEINRLLKEAHDETLAAQGNRSSDLYHPNVLAKYPRWVW